MLPSKTGKADGDARVLACPTRVQWQLIAVAAFPTVLHACPHPVMCGFLRRLRRSRCQRIQIEGPKFKSSLHFWRSVRAYCCRGVICEGENNGRSRDMLCNSSTTSLLAGIQCGGQLGDDGPRYQVV